MFPTRTRSTRLRRAAPVVLLAAFLLGPLVPGSALAEDDPRAKRFRGEAIAIVETTGDYAEAADHLVTTAMLMEKGDVDRATNLRLAGRLYHHARSLEKARFAMLDAGVAAFEAGESALAAHIFLDAAEVALEEGVPGAAQSAGERAGWVLRQGDLSAAERRSVLDRVRYRDTDLEIGRDDDTKMAG